MRLAVRHATVYRYDAPMRFVTQSLRLTPSACASQRTIDWTVAAEGALFGARFVDGAGDALATLTLQGPVAQVEILVQGAVETTDTAGVLRDHRETIWPQAYLQPTEATRRSPALLDLGAGALSGAAADELDRAHRLADAVAGAIAYAPGSTRAHTTAAEALEQGEGVCQDHAHAVIALAHVAGLPARYVVGYLQSREDGAPEEASHAWAEVQIARLGWVGFDAANRCCPNARYIRLGSGRDAREAAPIRGVSRGGGAEAMDVTVSVRAER